CRRGHYRMWPVIQMLGGHHSMQCHLEGTGRIGEEVGDTTQGFIFTRVKHMQDGANQQGMRSFLPVVAALQRAFRVHKDLGNILHIADFMGTAPHFQQGVVRRRLGISGIAQQAGGERSPPLMSWITAEAGQDKRVGTTRPTPLPERVGAKVNTCSGPSWRRYLSSCWPRKTPASPTSPARWISAGSAQRAEP